jgi:ribosome-associated protein
VRTASTLIPDDASNDCRLTPSTPISPFPVSDGRRRAGIAAHAAAEKKGEEIIVLDVGDIISITELFVLVSASNTRLVRTIVEEVELALKIADDENPRSVEGLNDATWVLMDYGDIIVHVFLAETRAFYDLDRLWADAPTIEWEHLAAYAERG